LQWVAPIVTDIEGFAFRGELLRPEIIQDDQNYSEPSCR